ncbi:uncharacterized protein LOC135847142 [Planococcus citri]|uniref:uncharacterized protein LOC135847142 n=1 Tax=Planococcus citri TaxID=170843 RepID=UPI0031F7DB98
MNAEKSIEAAADQNKSKKLIRSQYKDIMVKIDDDIYYLDRLQLALKSGYFEKLFTEDYSERNSDLIEMPLMDTDTFSAVIDVIYGEEVESVINSDNFVSLLMAMDYLQMDIDPKMWKPFAIRAFRCSKLLNKDIFKLCDFIALEKKFEYILPVVFEQMALYLEKLSDRDEFLSVKFDHMVKILSHCRTYSCEGSNPGPFRTVSKICARWICHDMKNRLHHALNLLNAARLGFHLSNTISDDEFNLRLSANDQNSNENTISRHIYKWLMYCGEIHSSNPVGSETSEAAERNKRQRECGYASMYSAEELDSFRIWREPDTKEDPPFMFNREPKLESFLKNSYIYDITVKVGEKVYKLHRSVLKSECLYFKELFSKEYSEISTQYEEVPCPPSKDKIYSLDEIDSETFDIIVDHMYLGKIEPTSDIIVRLFKAVHILRIDKLKKPCCGWMETNRKDICSKNVVEMLNLIHAHTEYEKLNKVFLSRYIVDSWPKIDNLPQFADLFKAIVLPEGINSTDESKAYLFDKVDQETFKVIIDYIYFDKKYFDDDSIVRVLKASNMFKIEKLVGKCIDHLIRWCARLSSSDIKEVLILSLGDFQYHEVLNTIYLVKYTMQWPEVDVELFCTVPYDCLENMLMSNDLYFDDPRDLLDICSTWVVHDVENRYRLVPQIALAISRNRRANDDDYCIEIPSNLKRCTQDFVKNKIWEVLCSASVFPFPLFPNDEENEQTSDDELSTPVFVTSHEGRSFKILQGDGDEIVSFHLCENMPNGENSFKYPMSAAMINDTLFMLCSVLHIPNFYAYNFSSKKLFCLASDRRIYNAKDARFLYARDRLKYTLLNRCDEIYCCLEDSLILKYSFEFNRWMQISAADPDKRGICFASDGSNLYRMYEIERNDTTISYTLQVYDFKQNSWTSISDFPHLTLDLETHENPDDDDDDDECRKLHGLVFLNDYGFAAVFQRRIFIFDYEAEIWREIRSLPGTYVYGSRNPKRAIITQDEDDGILCVYVNKLYYYSESPYQRRGSWSSSNDLSYRNIIGIHNPKIHCMT